MSKWEKLCWMDLIDAESEYRENGGGEKDCEPFVIPAMIRIAAEIRAFSRVTGFLLGFIAMILILRLG